MRTIQPLAKGTAMMWDVWLWPLLAGAGAGALNAAVAGHLRLLPLRLPLPPLARRTVNLGLLANVGVGAAAAGAAVLVLTGVDPTPGLLCLLISASFVAFTTARWATNEVDKVVLRAAVCTATAAPAADPETVRALLRATPFRIYESVNALVPPRAGYRPSGSVTTGGRGGPTHGPGGRVVS